MAKEFTKFLNLEIPDRDEYYDSKLHNRNLRKVYEKKEYIENVKGSRGMSVIPISILKENDIVDRRIYHVNIDDNNRTEIFGRPITVSDYNKRRLGIDEDTTRLLYGYTYTLYFLNGKCYIYWI